MDSEKIGRFIKELREKEKWSQETLAEKLFCERTKINKIENGKRYIKIDDLILLSEIFDLSMEEIISGEKKNQNNKEKIDITFKEYLTAQNTKIKKLRIISVFLIIVILTCFSLFTITYFFQNYKSIRIYRFYGNSENYEINDGLLILSKDKIYFKIDSIVPSVEEISIYSEYEDKVKLVYQGSPNIILNDRYGYDSFVSYKDFINFKQKIFVVVNDEKIDLTFKEDFVNQKIVYKENIEIGKDDFNTPLIPKKIREEFNCENDSCYLERNDEKLIYSNETFSVMLKKKYYLYDVNNNLFEYQDLENKKNSFTINIVNDEYTCVSGNCKNAKNIYEKFYDSYVLNYLK